MKTSHLYGCGDSEGFSLKMSGEVHPLEVVPINLRSNLQMLANRPLEWKIDPLAADNCSFQTAASWNLFTHHSQDCVKYPLPNQQAPIIALLVHLHLDDLGLYPGRHYYMVLSTQKLSH